MKVVIMGSAAAEAVPSLFCDCDCCRQARRDGGKDLRMRTAYKIDEDTLVDYGLDIATQTLRFKVDWNRLDRVVVTHPHSDHLNPAELLWRCKGFSANARPLEVIAPPEARRMVQDILDRLECKAPGEVNWVEKLSLDFVETSPGREIRSGDLSILPLRASHGAWSEPNALNYFISRGGKTVLIANDTGFWKEETWNLAAGKMADLAIIDGTCCLKFPDVDDYHMGVNAVVRFRDRLLETGALKKDGIAVTNHFSHNGFCLQADMEAFFNPHGILVGYDGMDIDI